MYISKEEKELLFQAISALQQLYARIDDSVEEEKLIARANKIIAQNSPLNFNGLNFFNEEVNAAAESPPLFQTKTYVYHFTKKELKTMSKEISILFQNQIVVAHMRCREGYYELRARVNGKNYSGSGKEESIAVRRLISSLNKEKQPEETIDKKITFEKYVAIWLETAIQPSVKQVTYNSYINLLDNHILPKFGKRPMSSIRQFELQAFLNELVEQKKGRTAQLVYQLLGAVFSYAVIDGIYQISPMAKIKKPKHEPEHGAALTYEEESKLVAALKDGGNRYVQAFVFMLYTGLRRSELKSVVVRDGWVHLLSAKQRRDAREKPRSVPVSPMLRAVLPYIDVADIVNLSADSMTKNFKDYVPGHHLHDTRHTFITRCQECGVRREIVSLWAGHSADSSITTTIYTHLEQNKVLQIAEIGKVNYRLP